MSEGFHQADPPVDNRIAEARARPRQRDSFPVTVGEVGEGFPFVSWAGSVAFKYPKEATQFLCQCDSAAEAFFLRPFCLRSGVIYGDYNLASADGLILELQVRCASYRIDAVVSDHRTRLAVEIDGMEFHHRTNDQVADDYLRERRIVLQGYTVIRFTAQEAFKNADECWRQIEAILEHRRRSA